MAVDLQMEKFAIDTFIQVFAWLEIGETPIKRPKDYGNINETDCTMEISHLVLSRYLFYRGTLINDLTDDYKLFSRNGDDMYYFLRKHAIRCFPYPEMNIFDKLLASMAFAAHMGALCYFRNNILYKYVLPLSWAMYFEKEAKEEFYAAGGLEELKAYATVRDARIIDPDYVIVIALQQQKDIEIAKVLFKNSEEDYCLDTVVDTFKRRIDGRVGKCTCSKCLPLFDVLHWLSYASNVKIDDFKLAEGFFQIFLRMLTHKMFEEAYLRHVLSNIGDAMISPDPEISELENLALTNKPDLFQQVKTVYTERLLERLFATKRQDSSEIENGDEKSKHCVFCGEDLKKSIKSPNREDDFERVESLKSVIRETVSSIQSSVIITDSSEIEPTSREETSDTTVERTRLRLFLTLGLEPAFNLIMANSEQECQHCVQNIVDSMDSLKLKEKKGKSKKKKNKSKK